MTDLHGATAGPDEELMAAVRDGSRPAFTTLFERYRQPVWGFFRRRVKDPASAEDLTQGVFTALLEAAPRYEPRAGFRSYLFGIAFNVLQSERRRVASRGAVPLEQDVPGPAGATREDQLWVRAALERLDPDDREVVMLREYEGLSYQEIADVRGLPLNTVRTRLFRARLALRTLLIAEPAAAGPREVTKKERAR